MTAPEPTRRDFLRTAAVAGAAAAAGAATATQPAGSYPRPAGAATSCIFINLVGGPSHLDTFDPKPDAPADIRGPFRPIPTRVPGTHVSELFPKLAAVADKFALVRGMNHPFAPVHEVGFQLLNTGRLFRDGPDWPSAGAVMSYLHGDRKEDAFPPRHFVCPEPQVETGIRVGHGFGPGYLGERVPFFWGGVGISDTCVLDRLMEEHFPADPRYGMNPFGQNCSCAVLDAPRHPWRFITINQFSTVFDAPSWDCHAAGGSLATSLDDYRATVAPDFDLAFSTLLTDLDDRGLLDSTLVVATGEFGRTPHLNANGGRDHWPGCWTAIVAGGGVRGGQVLGASDRIGAEPKDRPVSPQELVATVFHALGVAESATIPGPDGRPVPVYPAAPVRELF